MKLRITLLTAATLTAFSFAAHAAEKGTIMIMVNSLDNPYYASEAKGASEKAQALGYKRVRVNSISPGYTATPMNTRPEMVHQTREFESQTPMQRMAKVEEIAGPALFLASDAASFCTGVDLVVDGGFVCW
ncbi:TPA: SDR family oxidoreductase [Klebsiella variicola subsp. variicola]